MLNCKARSSLEGIQNILSIKASMNTGLSDKLKIEFPGVIRQNRPEVSIQSIPDPNWLAGFVDGEGYFYVRSLQNKNYTTGFSISLVFSITQHVRDEVLLTKMIEYLGCGIIEKGSTRPDEVNFVVRKFSYVIEKVIPFFQRFPLQGIKYYDYKDFCEAADIIKVKGHLTIEGIKKINSLKSGMNRSRELKEL